MSNITEWIKDVLYPALYETIDTAFPEHNFLTFPGGWRSKTYLDGTPHKNRSDKTVVSKTVPGFILEQGGEVLSLVDYVMRRDNVDFIQAVSILAKAAGIEFSHNNISFDTLQPKAYKPKPITPPKPISFIHVEIFKASLKGHEANLFVKILINHFGSEIASAMVSRYFIGTSKHWNGATVFWQIDIKGKVRGGKIMLYNPDTGKRVQKPFIHINCVHTVLKLPDFELRQCLFGEHLLSDKTKPVAIVESEKTAVIASVYMPKFIWLATGGLNNLNAETCSILKDRIVVLYPDLGAFDIWNKKAEELSYITNFQVSDFLECYASEEEKDIADYLLKEQLPPIKVDPGTTEVILQIVVRSGGSVGNVGNEVKIEETTGPLLKPATTPLLYKEKLDNWDQDIIELENYFTGIKLPVQLVKLNQYSTITNVSLFIESHFDTLKTNNGKRTFLPFLNRLQELRQVLINNLGCEKMN